MRWFPLVVLLSIVAIAMSVSPIDAQDSPSGSLGPQMISAHNDWRQKYGVPPLVWDNALAADAQAFATQVAAKAVFPPKHRSTSVNGENFFWGTGGAFGSKDAVARWEGESKNYDRGTNTCAPGKFCVHFTQLVWSTTTRMGCGKATTANGETDFFVCVYYPAGNVGGQGPFAKVSASTASANTESTPERPVAMLVNTSTSSSRPEPPVEALPDLSVERVEPALVREVNLNSHPKAKSFKTNLKEALSGGVNFAGHFIVATWGCGTGCQESAIIDGNTGNVFFPPQLRITLSGGELNEKDPLEYKDGSRLLVLNGCPENDAAGNTKCGSFYYEWTGQTLKLMRYVKN
jgi:uncharacterized protein YkwD